MQNISAEKTAGFPLLELTDVALHLIAAFVSVPMVHELMRVSTFLRARFQADSFWQLFYATYIPNCIHRQVDGFNEVSSFPDKVAVAWLRFCHSCSARRLCVGPCSCGAVPRFNSIIRFDARSYEISRLRLWNLKAYLILEGLDLRNMHLRFSSRYHGSSLKQMLRRAASAGKAHLLVCEGRSGDVFGAFLGFPIRRCAHRGYGKGDRSFLFNLGSSSCPQLRIYLDSDATVGPARSLPEAFTLGLDGEVALGLDSDLQEATCHPSNWCRGASLASTATPLASVAVFSDSKSSHGDDARSVFRIQDLGEVSEVKQNVDAFLLDLSGSTNLRDYFA